MAITTALSGPTKEAHSQANSRAWLRWAFATMIAMALLAGGYVMVTAQTTGDRGIRPTASSADIEITGIKVDVTADSALEARDKAWREAQRKAWEKAGGPSISDGQLQSMVSAIVIQRERIGAKRYIATLGVAFDRQRAGRFLGGTMKQSSSAPMLLLPVMASAGTFTMYEVRNPWQRAWAQFNPGTSRINYVRPSGAGGDSLLLNYGQTTRRSRAWWSTTLDQYGAADVLVPIVRLKHQYPGGPIKGTFVVRFGPDSEYLDSFEMTADSPDDLPEMLSSAVERIDTIFSEALAEGKLKPDPTLNSIGSAGLDPAVARLIELGRQLRNREAAEARARDDAPTPDTQTTGPSEGAEPTPAPAPVVSSVRVQFATPDPGTFDAALSGVRGTPGVRGVSIVSTAMGGTSVMSVTFSGSGDDLAAALRSRGFRVSGGGNSLSISR